MMTRWACYLENWVYFNFKCRDKIVCLLRLKSSLKGNWSSRAMKRIWRMKLGRIDWTSWGCVIHAEVLILTDLLIGKTSLAQSQKVEKMKNPNYRSIAQANHHQPIHRALLTSSYRCIKLKKSVGRKKGRECRSFRPRSCKIRWILLSI